MRSILSECLRLRAKGNRDGPASGHRKSLEEVVRSGAARKPFATHSGPSKQVSYSSLAQQRPDHKSATLSPSYGISPPRGLSTGGAATIVAGLDALPSICTFVIT